MTDSGGQLFDRFSLQGRVAVVTGGAGFLGREHAAALLEAGAAVLLLDLDSEALATSSQEHDLGVITADITDAGSVRESLRTVLEQHGRVDILVNNAARNPVVEGEETGALTRLEHMSLDQWLGDLAVGLTGAFLCSQAYGAQMAEQGRGVILNIASDLSVIAPDQRLYRRTGVPESSQPVKPVSYSVVKAGLIGLTRYLATYWAHAGVRANSLSPGGVLRDQPEEFVTRIADLIPMGRMAAPDEYRAAVQFLCSDASSYMTGQNVVIDGGRSVW